MYFGWRWIFLGWSVDVNDIFKKVPERTEEQNSILAYTVPNWVWISSIAALVMITKYIKSEDFQDDIPSNYSEDFSGIKVDIKGLNLYYIFNNRKFSYPAAFSQSTNQRRNAGTFIAGFSISKHHLNFDYTALPGFIQDAMNPAMKVKNIKYTNANISFGYAYNWVFARNCLACLSLTPPLPPQSFRCRRRNERGKSMVRQIQSGFSGSCGIVYNTGKYYVATSFCWENYNYHRNNFSVDNGFGTLQIYAGFNFNTRKEYRKKK